MTKKQCKTPKRKRESAGSKGGTGNPRCKAKTKSGKQCKNHAMPGDDYCNLHSKDPERVKQRQKHQEKAGKASGNQRRVDSICKRLGHDQCEIISFDEMLRTLSAVYFALLSLDLGPIDIQSIAAIGKLIIQTMKVRDEIERDREDTGPVSLIMRPMTIEDLNELRQSVRRGVTPDTV